ncbi:MAG: NADH-quinone oxidoreductase subunit [Pseudonocardiales bacterium]|jgi:NADH-quinone oxidoreductase subunit E|nr:NADH-quinone oxidoreductase subunit [Pseudonocardiales bacterium]
MTVTPSTSTGPNYGTEPFGGERTRDSLPTSAEAGRTNFRTSVIQLDRPGDSSVFDEQTHAEARELMARYPAGQARSALLPMLHLVQSVQGHVTADGIAFCAEHLELTKAQVSAVATFYTMYKRSPTGEYLVSVCTNTLCGMMGGDEIFSGLKQTLGVGNNETTADGTFTLEHAECLAACDYAPVVTVNYEFFDNQSIESATELVDQLRAGHRPAPTRGAPLCTFRQIERQIAGFFDEAALARDANSSGVPTERGVVLALQRGDTAPSYAARDDRDARPATQPRADQAQQTSANDAPLTTARSDDAHEAQPPGGHA